jgi:hypothetical protein
MISILFPNHNPLLQNQTNNSNNSLAAYVRNMVLEAKVDEVVDQS